MNNLFQRELVTVSEKYPNLSIRIKNGLGYLKGILDILDESGKAFGQYSIEIHESEGYPYRYPKLYEVGGEIPSLPDWHKYENDLCCLCVEQDEILSCNKGIKLDYFIEKVAMPYFANQIFRNSEGHYLNEYSHGLKGYVEFYTDLFKSGDVNQWELICDYCFNKPKLKRYQPCYCGSGVKFKKCHKKVEESLWLLGKEKVLSDLKNLRP